MQEAHHSIGSPPIPLVLRVSPRARRLSLRVSSLDGRITLTRPAYVGAEEALDFARSREVWLREQLAQQSEPVRVEDGTVLPVEGRPLKVATQARRGVHRDGDSLHAPERATGAAIEAWLKALAREHAGAAVERYAKRLGETPARLSLRDTRSRWGSCTTKGGIMLSWRLILAPPEMLDYVAAHEVAHLRHMDHSPAFWAVLDGLYPERRAASAWLRAEGPTLHRYRFRD